MEGSNGSTNEAIIEKNEVINDVKVNETVEVKDQEIDDDHIKKSYMESENDFIRGQILDHIKTSSAIFQSQQMGDPELTTSEKRRIAEELFNKNPGSFLLKFGEFLKEEHLNYFLSNFSSSYEIQYYAKTFKKLLNDHYKKVVKRNRRYEAMKRMEAEGNYFSEVEMEKREPLLYHQMIGQYLSEKEKLVKYREAQSNAIPSFSSFLINKMEREEMNQLVKSQQEEEDKMESHEISSEEEPPAQSSGEKWWGEDWDEEKSRKKTKKKQPKKQKVSISAKEKKLFLQEFMSIMKNNFLNGKDADFNYSEVDLNPEYDSVDLRAQDEEEKYFDEETNDATVCTDTGIEDY